MTGLPRSLHRAAGVALACTALTVACSAEPDDAAPGPSAVEDVTRAVPTTWAAFAPDAAVAQPNDVDDALVILHLLDADPGRAAAAAAGVAAAVEVGDGHPVEQVVEVGDPRRGPLDLSAVPPSVDLVIAMSHPIVSRVARVFDDADRAVCTSVKPRSEEDLALDHAIFAGGSRQTDAVHLLRVAAEEGAEQIVVFSYHTDAFMRPVRAYADAHDLSVVMASPSDSVDDIHEALDALPDPPDGVVIADWGDALTDSLPALDLLPHEVVVVADSQQGVAEADALVGALVRYDRDGTSVSSLEAIADHRNEYGTVATDAYTCVMLARLAYDGTDDWLDRLDDVGEDVTLPAVDDPDGPIVALDGEGQNLLAPAYLWRRTTEGIEYVRDDVPRDAND